MFLNNFSQISPFQKILRALSVAISFGIISNAVAQSVDGGTVVIVGPNNALSAQQAADGYQLLWNGKDFTGWKSWQTSVPGTNWAITSISGVENNAKKSLVADSNILEVTAAGESIWTTDTNWQDFDLEVEWMTPGDQGANSGILTRYSEAAGKNNNASAPEYQIINSKWAEWTDSNTTAGTAYEIYPLNKNRRATDYSPTWTRASGHWNQSRIVSFGRRTAHYGNGLKLVEYNMLTPDWNARYQKSKYASYPYYATVHPGSVFIQDHGQPYVKFRNIKIKKLTKNPWGAGSPYSTATANDTALVDTLSYLTDLFPNGITGLLVPKNTSPSNGFNLKTGSQFLFNFENENGKIDHKNILGRLFPNSSEK